MPASQSRWRASPARLARLFVGLVLFGAGEGLLVHSALGNSPWSVLAEGAGEQVGVGIGLTTIAISALILLAWIPLGQRVGFGTVANAIVIGLGIDVVLAALGPASGSLAVRLAEVAVAIVLVGVGSGLYLTARLGAGTRDGLMTGLAQKTGHSLRSVRVALELGACALGVALGGTIGIGTLAFALLVGPAVQLALGQLGARDATDL